MIDQHGEPDDWHDPLKANWPTFYLLDARQLGDAQREGRCPCTGLI